MIVIIQITDYLENPGNHIKYKNTILKRGVVSWQ